MFAVKGYEMQKMDQYMINDVGIPSCVLMENAAKSIVDDIIVRFPIGQDKDGKITIICGTGNNGGDGMAIGRWLLHLGYDVHFVIIGKKERRSEDHQLQETILNHLIASQMKNTVLWIDEDNFEIDSPQIKALLKRSFLTVDSLLGTGCNRTVSILFKDIIEYMNHYSTYIISVDVPSGINSDNGKVMGAAVQADITYTFAMPKIGLILYPGAEYTGELIVKDIGIIQEAQSLIQQKVNVLDQASIKEAVAQGVFERKKNTHKGNFGILGIIAGDDLMLGATILAVKAAYRTGAGLVKVFTSEKNAHLILAQVAECVIVEYDARKDLSDQIDAFANQVDVIAIGPGLSQSNHAHHLVRQILRLDKKVIFDADALNIIAKNMEWFEEKKCSCVITPHIGEMSRLTGYCSSGILENPIHFGTAMMEKYHIVTVLKSARTVVAAPEDQIYINTLGNPGMSTAGSGDVLVGIIGGLVAQGQSLADAARYGVLLHSYAGDYYASDNNFASLMASDIIDCLWKGL
jgi:NAD(P)H-hydrate epimerase